VHHHRDARTNSGRAARLRQRFFLQVVDWRVIAETDERFVVLPNEYLGQWAGKRLRVKEPAFSGGPNARGSDAVSGMVRDGKAIVYDHDFTNVITMPQGVRCHLIHREVRLEKVGQTHHADHPWSDGVHLWRALKAKADKDGNYSVGKIPNCKIFDKSLSGMVINPDKNRTIYSAGMLLDDLRRLAQDMSLDGNLSDDGVGSGPLLKQMYKDLLETSSMMRHATLALACLVGAAAQQYSGGGAYEAELQRRQMEYQQQQRLRQAQQAQAQQYLNQQQGGGMSQQMREAQYQQAAAQQAQAAQQAKLRQQMQQQAMYEAQMRAAQSSAGAGGVGGPGMGSMGKKPMSKKEKKKQEEALLKKQKAQQAAYKKQLDAQKKAAAQRQKAFKGAQGQRPASRARGGMQASRGGGNPLGALLSVKGAVLVGSVGYLWVAQRPLMLSISGKVLKYPILILTAVIRSVWTIMLKPIIRKLLLLKGGAGAASAGGELPGGAY